MYLHIICLLTLAILSKENSCLKVASVFINKKCKIETNIGREVTKHVLLHHLLRIYRPRLVNHLDGMLALIICFVALQEHQVVLFALYMISHLPMVGLEEIAIDKLAAEHHWETKV